MLTNENDEVDNESIEGYFKLIFEQQQNNKCYQCGKRSKQQVQKNHGLFLCLTCAANYEEINIHLNIWTTKQLSQLLKAGNHRFKQFLIPYQLDHLNPKDKLRTKAAEYYRLMSYQLIEEANGKEPPQPPSPELGRQYTKMNISITEMSKEQILDEAKEKVFWLGSTTKQFSINTFNKIHDKITSGELKQQTKKIGSKVAEGASKVAVNASLIWGSFKDKIKNVSNNDNTNNRNTI